jgi:hypothetical protein
MEFFTTATLPIATATATSETSTSDVHLRCWV